MKTSIYGNISIFAEKGGKEAALYLALSDIENKNFQNAEHRLESLSIGDDLGHWLDWAKGQVAFQNKKYDTAYTYLTRLLEDNPLFYSAYPVLLETLYNLAEFEKARLLSEFVIDSLPGYYDPVTFESQARNLNKISGEKIEPDTRENSLIAAVDDDLDQIIEEIEMGEYDRGTGTENQEVKSEFGEVMSEIFSEDAKKEVAPSTEPEDLKLSGLIEKTLNGNGGIAESLNQEETDPDKVLQNEQNTGGKRIVSKTLGEIYASQGQIKESIKVFEKLLEQNPDDDLIKRKISELKKL